MGNPIYIKDSYGNDIPLMDAYGNLSMEVIMLYSEDKLTAEDRKMVETVAAEDEMSKDALEGYLLAGNISKTRYTVGELNSAIQKVSGAAPIASYSLKSENTSDFRKIAAAIAALLVLGTGTYFIANEFFLNDQLAETTSKTTSVNQEEALKRSETKVQAAEEVPIVLEDESEIGESESSETVLSSPVTTSDTDKKKEKDKQKTQVAQQKSSDNKAEEKAAKANQKAPIEKVPQIETEQFEQDADQLASNPPAKDKQPISVETATVKVDEELTAENADILEEVELASTRGQESERRAQSKRTDNADLAKEQQALGAGRAGAILDQAKTSSAKYPGGDIAMYKFIEKRKVYTEAMQALNLSGSVTVTFDIEVDGRIVNAKVKTGSNGLMNEDALRVVRSMPKWKPATDDNGEPIKSTKSVVIKYGN